MTSDVPQYSADGLIGLSLLASEWAHSIFYFEDGEHEDVYERLLKKIFPDLKPFAVACTGGKSISIKVAKKRHDTSIPCIIVVDKDYDDLIGTLPGNLELGILYLKKYSIENYLVEIGAIIEVAIELMARDGVTYKQNEISKKLFDRDRFIEKLKTDLIEIGRWFVFVQKNKIDIQSTKIPGDIIFDGAEPAFPLPFNWFENYRERVLECVKTAHEWMIDCEYFPGCLQEAFDTTCTSLGQLEPADHIVGKHLLFGLLCYLDARLGTSLREMESRELYLRILNHLTLEPLTYLKEQITQNLKETTAFRT
jgi:hypothetical protein